MKSKPIKEIISLCRRVNQRSIQIYTRLFQEEGVEELKVIWGRMAEEETIHAAFWNEAQKQHREYTFPDIFDHPERAKGKLEAVLGKIEVLFNRWETKKTLENALILAYRMEYHMLHPTFERLFTALKPLNGDTDPSDTYDRHMKRFMEMFIQYGRTTPELELLGETLQSLWQRNKALVDIAMIDGLTGLFNRRGFLIVAQELFSLAHRKQENIAIFMIDIDHFKKVNDRYGHPKGDIVLKSVAKSLKRAVRESDVLCRYGGEEFVILFPDIRTSAVPQMAEEIRKRVEKSRPEGIPVTISIGAKQGLIQKNSHTRFLSWISKADEYLYKAKSRGRNCVVHDC